MYDIIIIGGGPAGMTAALYARRANKTVLILEKENMGGQIANSPKVENFPTIPEISGLDLTDRMFNQILDLGAEFELEEVQEISKNNGVFAVKTNYNSYEGRSIIVANGSKHKLMGLDNEINLIGKGIYFCATCDGPFYKGKETYVIGDANTALQYALLLSAYCKKVHVITLFDHFFGDKILQDRVLAKENIDVTHNMLLKEYVGGEHLESLVFENTQTKEITEYKTDNVFVAIGQVPSNKMLEGLVEMEDGFIITNQNMETSHPGIFACGDTRKKAVKQAVTACSDGAIAAMSAVKYLN